MSSRLERDRVSEKDPGPWFVFCRRVPELRLGLVSSGHPQQIAHPHSPQVVRRLGRSIIGEKLQHLVVQAELALGDSQPNGCRCEALAQRIEYMWSLGIVGRPPRFSDDAAVPD